MTQTPWEAGTKTKFTSLSEEKAFLDALAASSPRVAVDYLGNSAGGRAIYLTRIGRHAPPPRVGAAAGALMVTGCPHGNELAGREALHELVRDFAETTTDTFLLDYLEAHPVFVVTCHNPDALPGDLGGLGSSPSDLTAYQGLDVNANNVNPNRDSITIQQPEPRMVAQVVSDTWPELHLDLHEAVSTAVTQDAALLSVTDSNTDADLRALGADLVAAVRSDLTAAGLTSQLYSGSDTPTTLRNASGVRHSIGVLCESKNWDGQPATTRIETHRRFLRAALKFHADNGQRFRDVQAGAALRKTAEGKNQSRAFDLTLVGGVLLDPPPTGYRLTDAQVSAAAVHTSAFRVLVENGVAWMHQRAQTVIPYLLDASSNQRVVDGVRIYDTPYSHRYEWWDGHRWRETTAVLPDGTAHYPLPASGGATASAYPSSYPATY